MGTEKHAANEHGTGVPSADAGASRHMLPTDLPGALKHLPDQELDRLQAAVSAEQQRRGRKQPLADQPQSKLAGAGVIALTPGKLNAVRAAFKAGVTPARIAKQFGVAQSDVQRIIGGLRGQKAENPR